MTKKFIIPALVVFFTAFVFMAFYGFDKQTILEKKPTEEIETPGGYDPIVVLELFTSQGCSSCPPADVLLQKVKQQYPDKVFALSYHVDYWNYIGWEDPFSKSQYTTKQRFYNRKLGYNGNYTPEAIVNGREHFVGSSSAKMNAKISKYGETKAENKINLENVNRRIKTVTFDFSVEGDLANKLVRAVLVLDERTTSVKRGENRSRILTNSNIVVAEKYLEVNGGAGSGQITLPALVNPKDVITLMLITETDNLDVTGATKLKLL